MRTPALAASSTLSAAATASPQRSISRAGPAARMLDPALRLATDMLVSF